MNGKGKLFRDPELRGFIDSLDFEIESNKVQWYLLPESPDICTNILNKALKSGDTIQITTPFHVKIPKGVTSRLGHIGESYQISQWYPKPAVYDRAGWHQIPYLDQAEFYSEFRIGNGISRADCFTIEEIEKRSLVYVPVINWNSVDGFMTGLFLNNGTLVPKKGEYFFIPFYTLSNQWLTGYGRISFNIIPYDNLIRIATFTLEGEQFGAPGNQKYHKAKIGLDLGFRPVNSVKPVNHRAYGYFYAASDLHYIELLRDIHSFACF